MLELRHLQQLQASSINEDVMNERPYYSIPPGSIYDWRQIAGPTHSDGLLKTVLHQGALAFPLYRCADPQPYTWVLRPDQPRTTKEGKPIKYEYPAHTANILDVLPRYREALKNPAIDVWVTEGVKKADALASAYHDQIVPINENGVWGWRTKGRMLDDFQRIVWEGRRVILAPDGDVRVNKAVHQAVQRSAKAMLGLGAAEVLILLLPNPKDGPKMGVDDYLAQGHTLDELESHLVELGVVGDTARISLMKHPTTGAPLYLPSGYDMLHKQIVRTGGDGQRHIYSGLLAVTGTGKNLHSQEEILTITWDRFNQLHDTTIPRSTLASGTDCGKALSERGAFVHSINAREVSRYLVEFIRENDDVLPRTNLVDRLGVVGSEGLVLPAGNIGVEGEVRYTGSAIEVGADHDAYKRVLHQVATWDNLVTLWTVFGLGLAAPALARMRPDRNPVLLLANASGSGKTTLTHFTVGAYGDPTRTPLRVQCGSGNTTPKGIQQVLTETNGLPVHLEDVHMLMARDPNRFAGLIYDYANGQLRTYGQVSQRAGGGQTLGGLLLMTGEMLPEFSYEGSQRRTMTLDCRRWWPLGAPPRSDEGDRRAHILDSAYLAGSGLFGKQVCELIWANWPTFLRDVAGWSADPALGDLQAWRPLLATGAVVLRLALHNIGIELDWQQMMRQWASIYVEGQKERDPGVDAFDRVLVMLSQCEIVNNSEESNQGHRSAPTWEWLHYERKMVAARRVGECYWRVLTTSPQWRAVIGVGAVDMFGESWLKNELILTHKGARKVSDRIHTGPGKGNLQCILVPEEHFTPTDNM